MAKQHSSSMFNSYSVSENKKFTGRTRCRLPERFASTWPNLIIASDVRGHGEWLHCCSRLPLQLASASCRLFAYAFHAF